MEANSKEVIQNTAIPEGGFRIVHCVDVYSEDVVIMWNMNI